MKKKRIKWENIFLVLGIIYSLITIFNYKISNISELFLNVSYDLLIILGYWLIIKIIRVEHLITRKNIFN